MQNFLSHSVVIPPPPPHADTSDTYPQFMNISPEFLISTEQNFFFLQTRSSEIVKSERNMCEKHHIWLVRQKLPGEVRRRGLGIDRNQDVGPDELRIDVNTKIWTSYISVR